MNDHYKILHLEDVAYDAELAARELRKGNIHFEQYVVDSEAEYLQALDQYKPDIILCDHSLSNFNSTEALKIFKARKLNIPFILITATLTDEVAINILKDGADDYILKDRMKRLPVAVKNAFKKIEDRLIREKIETETRAIEAETREEMQKLTNRLRLATKSAAMGIWEWDIKTNALLWDEGMFQLYNIDNLQFGSVYEGWLSRLHPDDKLLIDNDLQLAVEGKKNYDTEFRIIWLDSSIRYIRASGLIERDDLGNALKMIGANWDITKEKKAEQELSHTSLALHNALGDLKKIMDSSLDVICSINEYGNFVNVSAASEKLWGYTPAELTGKAYKSFVYQEDQAKTTQAIAEITSGINMTNFENYQVHKDGSLVPMVLSARWDMKESMLYCIAREATEKKHADASLLISEQRFKDLVQGGSDLIVILNPEGNYLYVSPNSIDILGFPAEEFIGKNTFSFMHPDDKEIALQSFSRIADEKKILVPPIRFLHIDGSWRWLDSTVTNFINNPAINGIVINARDVTANKLAQDLIKESEAKYRAFFENSLDGILLTVTDGIILSANPAACEMFRMSEEEICMAGRFGLIDLSDRRAEELIKTRQKTGKAKGELTFLRKDGSTFPGEIASVLFFDSYGNERTSMILRDTTERKLSEDAIKASEAFTEGVLDSLSSHIAVINSSGTIIKVNKTWNTFALNNGAKTLGKFGEGANYFEVCENATGDDTAACVLNGIKEVLKGVVHEFYFEYPCHSLSEERWFYLRVRKFEGLEPLLLIEHQYITERKKSEEKLVATSGTLLDTLKDLNNIMDSSLDIICTIDESGKFVKVSAASKHIWGFTPAELIGRAFLDLVFDSDKDLTIDVAAKVKQGFSVTMFENRYIHKNGSIVPLLWSAQWDTNNQMMYCIAKDAREKKRLEKNIEFERKRIQALFYHAPTLIGVLKGRDYVFEMANDFCLKLIAKKDVVGKRLADVLPEVIEQGFIQILDNVYTTGKNFMASEILLKVNNEESGQIEDIYLNLSYQPYRDVEGAIEGIFFFAVDVTEQVLSRKEIELSERKYREIVETAQEGIWLVDEHNKTTFVNHKMFEILGYSSDEMLGKEIFELMDEEGKELAAVLMQEKKKGKSGQGEFKYISKGGKEVWTNISANPLFRDDGIYTGSLAMITDITDKRSIEIKLAHSETSLKEAQAIAKVGNWEINLETNIQFWSDEMYNIFGINIGDVTPSLESFLSFVTPAGKKMVEEKMREPLQNEQETVLHLQLIRPDGEIRYVHSKWRYKFDKVNNPIQLSGILQDVSQLKIAEIERSKMVKDLIQRNKDLEQFNYIVSHNLRAPVANIIGFADALSDSAYPESLHKEFLSQLTVSVSKLDQVIRDINGVLLIRQKANDVKELLSFSAVVKNIEISIQNLIQRYKVTIETDFKEVDNILSIKSFLHSILYNLISNSIKYRSPQHAPAISIKSQKTDEGIQLIFCDNGLGIDLKKYGESLFGLYKRFHLNIEGKGLGLFMTKSQIETLGGTIGVSSEINRGTTFKIYLPS